MAGFQNMASMEAKVKYLETEVTGLKKRTDTLELVINQLMNTIQNYISADVQNEEGTEDVEEGDNE